MKHWGKNYRRNYERYHNCCLLDHIDIHHIDGNHNNNDPLNLQPVTLQEHYNNHYACYMIAIRMEIPPEDWKKMASENGRKVAYANIENGVGLIHWAKNNPEEYKASQKCGGKIGGKIAYEQRLGLHSLPKERKLEIASQGGKRAAELGLGFKLGHASTAGKLGGKKGGAYAKANRTGIFALTPEQNKQRHFNSVVTKMIKSGRASAWPRKETI